MKKKFVTGLLLLAVTAGGVSTFTSCKDTNEDLYAELRGENATLRADLLKEIADKCEEMSQKLNDYALKSDLDDYVKNDEFDAKVNALIATWATKKGLDDMKQTAKNILDQLKAEGYFDDLKGDGGADCTCALKDLTPEQARILTVLAGQAENLFGENLDGKGGMMNTLSTDLETLKDVLNGKDGAQGLIKDVEELQEILNGKDGKDGLVQTVNTLKGTVDDLSLYFKDFKDWEDNDMTPAQFQEYVRQGGYVISNKKALNKLVELINEGTLNEAALQELNKYYQDLAGIDEMYEAIFKDVELPEGAEDWWNYAQVMSNIMQNTEAIKALYERMDEMVTSLILQAANNKVYPAFNTPFGLNSMVLMTYYGNLATSVEKFPVSNAKSMGVEMNADFNVDWSKILSSEDYYQISSKKLAYLTEDGDASLGTLWFTVNPGTVKNLKTTNFSLVNSKDEESAVKFSSIEKDDETLFMFGMGSRAAAGNGNGLYRANATVALDKLDEIKVNIEPGLVDALKSAVKNHKGSDMLYLLDVIKSQLNNVCVANALRYTYTPVTRDENGNLVSEEEAKVYSNYGLAATAFKPLSFATLKGSSAGKHLPTIAPIEIDKDMVNLDLGNAFQGIDGNKFSIKMNFGKPTFNEIGKVVVETEIKLTDQVTGHEVKGDVKIDISKEAQQIVNNITESIDEWLGGKDGAPTLDDKVEKAIWMALFNDATAVNPKYPYDKDMPTGVVTDLVKQVNDMTGQIQDKLDDLVNQINKDYLGKVNNLLGKYNTIADRINGMLDDPNHYLQAVMFYNKPNGGIGLISTDAKNPTPFKFKGGDAITLYATTYNFETISPTFKKIVGVTKVTDEKGVENTTLRDNANKAIAKVVNGDQTAFALNVAGAKGGVYTYEIAYQALDYTGHTSTVKTYIKVIGK
ncbi:MAG: hypothetical protein K2J84_06180 [Bacteroidaceae bacterium]|nr:hypothetical protein [Bacteroidaceae bacterium]